MGEVLLELTSSQHCDYCRNDRWEQGDRLLYLHPYLVGKLTITARSPAGEGDPPAIDRFLDIGWRSTGPPAVIGRSPGKMAIWGLLQPVTVQSPTGDRQVIADPVIRMVQGHQNRAASTDVQILQSGKNPAATAGF